MALGNESGTGMIMPVAPTSGGFGNGFGGDGWWIILLFVLLGGWGNCNNMGNYGGGNGLYPWMNQSNQISDGFRDQMMNSTINGIQNAVTTGFGDVQNALCNGFASVQNGFAQAEIANNARQIADMQQNFALQSQLASCCCENRLATANLSADLAREACADRAASAANTQAILDKLCQLELDSKNTRIADLERQLTMANLAASQTAQTAQILAGQTAEIDGVYNRLKNCPVPSMPVYGNTPIFTCGGNNGCGCGCGA